MAEGIAFGSFLFMGAWGRFSDSQSMELPQP